MAYTASSGLIEAFQRALAAHPPQRVGECLEWTGTVNNAGYGIICYREGSKRYSITAHRAALLCAGVAMAPREVACHACDNRRCIEAAHLFGGSQQANLADMRAKGREIKSVPKPRDEWGVRFLALKRYPVEAVAAEFGVGLRTALRWKQKMLSITPAT